ncbi:MAG: hypothetical protein RBS16_02090 [Candidatus Cloacimonadales bacterium]|jgi:hypothetical protein|nr:hypothetical protein [Candidatus Cloacimonadota bacterium]MDD2649700.1 hypothetical protein [Candidatus Cloacimonadota bacterium]MDX9976804.1 hypothetical protein [Candidatus Cloacimonadales bacterium]
MNKLIIVIGAYGSGKSEYSINLARSFMEEGKDTVLVDLDVVNPYFRSRDVRDEFAKIGIEVVAPDGQFSHADLPMLSPKIKWAIENTEKTVILDVGGDPAGCRTLGRYNNEIVKRGYEIRFVVNTNRPFTQNKNQIIDMKNMLEATSKLKISELISNANLMEYTDKATIEHGIDIVKEVADELNLKFEYFLVLDKYESIVPAIFKDKKRFTLKYFLSKPWEQLVMKGI